MEENDIKETKEDIEEPTSNTSIKNDDEGYDKLSIKDFIEKEKVLEEKKIKEDKIDKRKISSRINIAKARAAKLRKAAEKKRQFANHRTCAGPSGEEHRDAKTYSATRITRKNVRHAMKFAMANTRQT